MTIKQIQHLLAYLGYYTAAVDGIWGSQSADLALLDGGPAPPQGRALGCPTSEPQSSF